jgi:hypothetical protein
VGGAGGRQILGSSFNSTKDAEETLNFFLKQVEGERHGAGGGGQGAVGTYARGGDGGAGGDMSVEQLWLNAGETVRVRPGKGGQNSSGEDTVVNIYTPEGALRSQLIARPGDAQYLPLPESTGTELLAEEIVGGFSVESLILSEGAINRRGMIDLLTTCFVGYEFPTVPFRANWMLAIGIYLGVLGTEERIQLEIQVLDPEGFCVLQEHTDVDVSSIFPSKRLFNIVPLQFSSSIPGDWRVVVSSGRTILGSTGFNVACPPVPAGGLDQGESPL